MMDWASARSRVSYFKEAKETWWGGQVMIWAVGLRGAVAYGLAVNLPQIDAESDDGIPAIETATLVVVVLSTLLFGGATGPLLRLLELQGVDDDELGAMGYAEMHDASPTSAMQVRTMTPPSATQLRAPCRDVGRQIVPLASCLGARDA